MKEFILVLAGEFKFIEDDNTILFECKNADNVISILKIPRTYKYGDIVEFNDKEYILLNSKQVEMFIKKSFG